MIHYYKLNGFNMVIDAASGAVHSVDEVAYDAIEKLDAAVREADCDAGTVFGDSKLTGAVASEIAREHGITMEDADETLGDIAELFDKGLLWSEDPFEQAADEIKIRQSVLKAICLHVAHGCNMDCEYCFAGKGDYSGKSGIMSAEVGKRALDYLVEHSGTRRHLEVDFFGGEPLINWDVCKEIVAYGRELEKKHNKVFNFTLTTNGVLIDDDVIDFTNREMGNVVLSMDGRRETHDRMRHSKTGGGTYDLIMDNFKALVDSRLKNAERSSEYYMRGTYTSYNKDFAADVLAMADLGFRETSIEPVVSDPGVPYALHEEDLSQLYEEYEKLALEMLRREERGEGFSFYHYTVDLTGGPCIYKRVAGCGVATEYLAVTPTGDLYPCHQFVGDEKYRLGDIWNGVDNKEIQDEFKLCNAYARPDCKDCWARLYCSGGCAANAYHATGSINGIYKYGCELFKKRMECAIMMKAALADND